MVVKPEGAIAPRACERCWLLVRGELMKYHGITEHGDAVPAGFKYPLWVFEKHLFTDGEFVSIGGDKQAAYGA